MHTVGPGIWREMTILENEKHTLQDVKYGGKIEKGGKTNTLEQGLWRKSEKNVENEKKKHFLEKKIMRKMRYKHCLTWNIARNTEKGGK